MTTDGPASQSARRPARLPLLGALGWAIVAGAAAQYALAVLWRDRLDDCGRPLLLVHYAAFMAEVFLFHAGLAAAAVLLIAVAARRRRLAAAATLAGALLAGPELASYRPWPGANGAAPARAGAPGASTMPTPASAPAPGAALAAGADAAPAPPTLRLLCANLMDGRVDPDALRAQVDRFDPDVLLLQEWTPAAVASLKPWLLGRFPHHAEVVRDDAFGQAVFSRRAPAAPVRAYPPAAAIREPQMTVAVALDGRPMRIVNTHLLPPVSPALFAEQRRGARALAALLRAGRDGAAVPGGGPPVHVLAGDFNATPRTDLADAFERAGLRSAMDEGGVAGRGTTWPRRGALAMVPGLRLDHVLVGPEVECRRAEVGGDIGSDHLPVFVELAWSLRP
jgi:endonuclease/exonuclease/phosphatase (EEP) superfamily protein YafD